VDFAQSSSPGIQIYRCETNCLCEAIRISENIIGEFDLKEIEKFIIRQPPKGEKDDYDSENSWISDGLPSSSRQRRYRNGIMNLITA